MFYIYFFVGIFVLQTRSYSLGIDHSNPVSVEQFKCLLAQNYTFTIIRAWRSYGAFDLNSPQTLANAMAGGFEIKDIGVYMFPCTGTRAPEEQVTEMLRQLGKSQF